MQETSNRRSAERIPMQVPVDMGGTPGCTRDISGGGVFFTSDQAPELGGRIRFSLELSHALPERPLKLMCQGQVVRIESLGQQKGIAATIERFSCTR